MSSGGEDETDAVSPLSRSAPKETGNLPQPTKKVVPATPAARIATPAARIATPAARIATPAARIASPNTRVGAPNRTPGPVNGTPRPAGPTRTPGPVRGIPRPTSTGAPVGIYKRRRISTLRRYCVPITTTVLVIASIVVIAILIKVVLDNYYFFCLKSFKFIPLDKWCDGTEDCASGEDESRCVQRFALIFCVSVRFSEQSALLIFMRSTNTWNWVCSDKWDSTRARAVCAQIGFSGYVPPTTRPVFNSRKTSLSSPAHPLLLFVFCVVCGSSHKQERIIGGSDSPIENWPWQASLQYMGQHVCGASFLNSYWLLTAAHCFKGQQPLDRWRIQYGIAKLTFVFGSQVDRIFIHGQYAYDVKPNDIALIKLKNAAQFSASAQPICLPPFDLNLLPSAVLWVTGWGNTQEGGRKRINILGILQVSIGFITSDVCNREYYGQILPTMLCAGREAGGADTCQGDSGGPLVSYPASSRWEQVGIVSFGDGCGRPGKVGVYTKVSMFLDWIYAVLKVRNQLHCVDDSNIHIKAVCIKFLFRGRE
uniref:Transmembrane protease serine 4 n=1 Tax=Leptobrachium leishanense TaxID=445787 RepID=A0A8C5R893_9ANUR